MEVVGEGSAIWEKFQYNPVFCFRAPLIIIINIISDWRSRIMAMGQPFPSNDNLLCYPRLHRHEGGHDTKG